MQNFFTLRAGIIVAITALCIITGCAAALIGLGAGLGTFAYVEGSLKKNYENEYDDAIQASTSALAQLKIPLTKRFGDEAKTTVEAKRANGTPVEIVILNRGENLTEIGVRTGVVGIWDRQASRQIHEAILEQLNRMAAEEALAHSAPSSTLMDAEPSEPAPSFYNETKPGQKTPSGKTTARTLPRESQLAATPSFDLIKNADKIIYFENGSTELLEAYRARLDGIAEMMRSDPAAAVTLHGYSDAIGSKTDNYMISAKRAHAVKAYLIEKGVNPDQIITIAHGATAFVATNRTEEGRQQNRRVEIEAHNFDFN